MTIESAPIHEPFLACAVGSAILVTWRNKENTKWICGMAVFGEEVDRQVFFHMETFPTHWMPLPPPPSTDTISA